MIIIDTREKEPEKLAEMFTEIKVENKIELLPVGDFADNEKGVVIEHKEIQDFVLSIYDGRLFEQALNMRSNYTFPYIIVVGTINDLIKKQIHTGAGTINQHVFLGTMASLTASYGVPVLTVDSKKQMVYLVSKLCEKQGAPVNFVNKIKMTDKDIYVNMLATIPGVGHKKARDLLDTMSFWEIIEAGPDKLQEVDGIGPKIAESVIKYLGKPKVI